MKKSTKRIISSILSLAMVLSLASCGKKEETPPADGTYKAQRNVVEMQHSASTINSDFPL